MKRVEYVMREQHKTQTAVSEATGINRVTINKVIRGYEKPWPKYRDAIAQALGWPLDRASELFEDLEV